MSVSLDIVRMLVESSPLRRVDSAAAATVTTGLDQLPAEWRSEWLERAAILEYDGGLNREEADEQALHEIIERLKRMGKG